MRKMYINGKAVGSGMWTLKSVKSYCAKKGIELKSASSTEISCNGYADDKLNLETGEYEYGHTIDCAY